MLLFVSVVKTGSCQIEQMGPLYHHKSASRAYTKGTRNVTFIAVKSEMLFLGLDLSVVKLYSRLLNDLFVFCVRIYLRYCNANS